MARFGSDPRPGGGGGLLAGGGALRMDPEGGGDDGWAEDGTPLAGPTETGRVTGDDGIDGSRSDCGVGSGIPRSVFFASIGTVRAARTCAEDPGGAGGAAAGGFSEVFFPRPSKMSRSDPPPRLLSFDIRVS